MSSCSNHRGVLRQMQGWRVFPIFFRLRSVTFVFNDEVLRPDVELCWLHRCWSWLWGIWRFCWDKATVTWQHLDMPLSILGRLAFQMKSDNFFLTSVEAHILYTFTWSSSFFFFKIWSLRGSCLLNTTLKVFLLGRDLGDGQDGRVSGRRMGRFRGECLKIMANAPISQMVYFEYETQ